MERTQEPVLLYVFLDTGIALRTSLKTPVAGSPSSREPAHVIMSGCFSSRMRWPLADGTGHERAVKSHGPSSVSGERDQGRSSETSPGPSVGEGWNRTSSGPSPCLHLHGPAPARACMRRKPNRSHAWVRPASVTIGITYIYDLDGWQGNATWHSRSSLLMMPTAQSTKQAGGANRSPAAW